MRKKRFVLFTFESLSITEFKLSNLCSAPFFRICTLQVYGSLWTSSERVARALIYKFVCVVTIYDCQTDKNLMSKILKY